ncbi:hypothetical protein ABEY43_06895 [Priestia megaterium]
METKLPKRVKFIGYKSENHLYATGLRRNKLYNVHWDDDAVEEIYNEFKTVTVTDDLGELHEINEGDYEVKE